MTVYRLITIPYHSVLLNYHTLPQLTAYFFFSFFSHGATTPMGVVFYSPLVGFSLLAYEVS